MSWFRRRPVSDMLAGASIATPSALVAQMIALRIAELPAEHSFSGSTMWLNLPIRGGDGVVEVRVQAEPNRAYWALNRCGASCQVGMPGSPKYRSVDLTQAEQLVIADAAHALHWRTADARAAARDAESQHSALDILEHLI